MICPTTEELAQLALGVEVQQARAHLHQCQACAEQLAAIETSLNRVAAAQRWFDRGHEAARAQLLAALSSTAVEERPHRPLVRFAKVKEVLTMKGALLGGAAALAALLLLAIWGSPPQTACAQTVKALKE